MNKIVCPKCREEFELTDADYLSIVDQVKTEEIAKAVNEKEKSLKIEKLNSKIRENELNRQINVMLFNAVSRVKKRYSFG